MTDSKQAHGVRIAVTDQNDNPIQGVEINISEDSFNFFVISDEDGEVRTNVLSSFSGVDIKCEHPLYKERLIRILLYGQGTVSTVQLSKNPDAQPDPSNKVNEVKSAAEDAVSSYEDVLNEFERIGNQLKKRPTRSEFNEHSRLESDDVYEYFDSWESIVRAAEIKSASKKDLVHDLRRLNGELGVPPLSAQIKEHGRFSVYDYQMEFGGVEDALEEIGIDMRAKVIDILAQVIHETEEKPKLADFSELTPYHYHQGVIHKWFNSWNEAIKATKRQRTSAIEPTFDEGVGAGPSLTQNELSELYGLIQNLHTLTDIIIQVRGELMNGATAESVDPMVNWAKKVDSFWKGESTDEPGYRAQQTSRNPFSMIEYRQTFGDGNRVTEFEYAHASRINPAVAALISPYIHIDTETLYLPVDPESSAPIPIIVESRDALRRASNMLQRLPSHPDSATSIRVER